MIAVEKRAVDLRGLDLAADLALAAAHGDGELVLAVEHLRVED
jgi:hypothetical protein